MMICKVYNENLMDDEYHLLFACSAYKAIHEDYDELIHMHDNKDGHICVHYFHIDSFYDKVRMGTYVCIIFT